MCWFNVPRANTMLDSAYMGWFNLPKKVQGKDVYSLFDSSTECISFVTMISTTTYTAFTFTYFFGS